MIASDVSAAGGADLVRTVPRIAAFIELDVRDSASFNAVVEDVGARFGELDLLVNNAGIGGAAGEAHRLTLEHWRPVLEVNLFGVVNGVQAVYPRMVERRAGQIVNIASLAGLGPAPFLLPYGTSKAAVVGLSRTLRTEGAMHGVKVNVVCPAAIETPILDTVPTGLPDVGWRPEIRRYLTSLAGPPYPVDRFATEALDAIERDEAVIVLPSRARLVWRVGRFLPSLAERATLRKAVAERGRS